MASASPSTGLPGSHTRNVSVNIEAITDLIKSFNDEQARNEAAAATARARAGAGPAAQDLMTSTLSGMLQPSANIHPSASSSSAPAPPAAAPPAQIPIQQTRSGRISRPPATPAQPARASPLRYQLSPRAGFVQEAASPSGSAGLSIDAIASSHLAILRNLMGGAGAAGGSNARFAAGMGMGVGTGVNGSAGETVAQPLQNQDQARYGYPNGLQSVVTKSEPSSQPTSAPPPSAYRGRKRLHSSSDDDAPSPDARPAAGAGAEIDAKTASRREKNKNSARQSRKRKEMMWQEMQARVGALEDELELAHARYKVLSQQHVQLQERYISLSQAVSMGGYASSSSGSQQAYYPSQGAQPAIGPSKAPAPESVPVNSAQSASNTANRGSAAPSASLNGITNAPHDAPTADLSFDDGAGQPWSSTLFDFLNTDFDDKEEEDTDYKPSSPVEAGAASALPSPAEGTPQATEEQEQAETVTPAAPAAASESDGDATMQQEEDEVQQEQDDAVQQGATETPGDEDDEDSSDEDMEYNEEDWEDDGLFLPIEDVPIPEEIKAIHQGVSAIVEQPPVPQPITATSEAAPTAAADSPTTGFLDHLAAVVSNPEGLAALQAILGGNASNGAKNGAPPDRGFGIGRGASAQDPGALLRQVFILNQNQRRTQSGNQG